MSMKNFEEIRIPPLEAERFFNNSEGINHVFYKNENYEKLFRPETYFLLGDKGSGKTMFSAYFCSEYEKQVEGKNYVISVDDYNKFIQMKKNNELNYTDYTTIWKVILMIKMLLSIDKQEINGFLKGMAHSRLQKIISSYNLSEVTQDAFSPTVAMDNREIVEGLENQHGGEVEGRRIGISSGNRCSKSEKTVQSVETTRLRYVDRWTAFLNDAAKQIVDLKLKKPHYLFVDGIDVRPVSIEYEDYQQCVSSLIRAVYEINHMMFSKIKNRTVGRLQIVILSRLDIFLESGLSNTGCKIVDNSVYLNWGLSNLNDVEDSDLYKLVNNVLSEGRNEADMWKHYMDFQLKRQKNSRRLYDSFPYCMRLTAARPRDFIRILQLLQEENKSRRTGSLLPLQKVFEKDSFQKKYSTYYVQSIQSEMSFYYNKNEYLLFFSFLKKFQGLKFTFSEFQKNLNAFYARERLKEFFGEANDILDKMYHLNIVCLVEKEDIYRWKYRETTIDNYCSSLMDYKIENNTTFIFHWAVEKALGVYIGSRK